MVKNSENRKAQKSQHLKMQEKKTCEITRKLPKP